MKNKMNNRIAFLPNSFGLKIRPLLGLMVAGLASSVAAQETNGLPASTVPDHPTYLRDVLPILMGNCSRCHNQESHFLYNWLDYGTAYNDRWEIRRRIWDSWRGSYYMESMPIQNSPESMELTENQRLIIRRWVDQGGAQGEVAVSAAPQNKEERIQAGQHLFASICAACHQPTGLGRPNVFPPLAGSDFLNADKNRAIGIVIHGRQGEVVVNGQTYNNSMPSFPLTDENIADVLTYVYNSFGNSGLEVTAAEVKSVRATPVAPETPAASSAPAAKNAFE